MIPYHGIPVLPGLGQTHGDQMIGPHAENFFGSKRGGLVLTLYDVWAFNPKVWRELNLACWVPIDHEPAPPLVREFFAQTGAIPIAMSKFGQEQLADFDALYVPHGCDTKIYRPMDKTEAREATKIPQDKFVVGMVAANKGVPSRKCFPHALLAFKAFHDRHPESVLYLHTAIHNGPGIDKEAVNLVALMKAIGLTPGDVVFANQDRVLRYPFTPEQMAAVYSSLDVLLSASGGEGFGLSVLEANACGIPAIATDFSAQPEVCGAGWLVEYERVWTAQRSWQASPSVPDMIEALESSFRLSKAGRQEAARKARAHAEQYDVNRVLSEHMLPALTEVRERLEARQPRELVAA